LFTTAIFSGEVLLLHDIFGCRQSQTCTEYTLKKIFASDKNYTKQEKHTKDPTYIRNYAYTAIVITTTVKLFSHLKNTTAQSMLPLHNMLPLQTTKHKTMTPVGLLPFQQSSANTRS
jgi:hypothetical protein